MADEAEEANRMAYVEIFRKMQEDQKGDLADALKKGVNLTEEEISSPLPTPRLWEYAKQIFGDGGGPSNEDSKPSKTSS